MKKTALTVPRARPRVARKLQADAAPRVTGAQSPAPPAGQIGQQLENLAARIRVCLECPLHASRTIAVPGEGPAHAPLFIIGEGPGKNEDQVGRPFVGSAGKYLDHVFAGTGLQRADFFITNIVKCRPPNNRTPRGLEVDTCTRLYLFAQIKLVNPAFVLLLGAVAVKKMLGYKGVEEARGKIIELDGRKFLASYHPAVRFYREDLAGKVKADFALLKRALLKTVQ